jgi:hypothetical protein
VSDEASGQRVVRRSAVSNAVLVWAGSEPAGSAVRQAQWTVADPFDNPFGDRPTSAPTAIKSPETTESGATSVQPDPFRDDQPFPSLQPEVPKPSPFPTDEAPVPPGDLQPGQPALPPFPDTFGLPPSTEPPCDRTYNNRNCCVEGDKCEAARRHVMNDKITNIGIDITPAFTNTELEIPTDVMMRRELAKAPARVWRDRSGRQLAEGRLLDYREGRIHVGQEGAEPVKIPFKDLSDDDLCFVTAWWSLPTECPLGDEIYSPRSWLAMNMMWKASALCHKPLYFEEVQLERYGHTTGPLTQPVVSAAHFFGSLVALPYQMGIHPPGECMYTLGYYRPGSCAPWLLPPVPLSIRGGLAEAGAIVGGIYVIP